MPAQDRLVVVGAAGFTSEQLYMRNMVAMGVPEDQLAMVELPHRLDDASKRHPTASVHSSIDEALTTIRDQGNTARAIFIASNTGAHVTNLREITDAADQGLVNLSKTRIWSEKPVADPEEFSQVADLAEGRPDFDLSVGYILRFSETLNALRDHLEANDLTISSLEWFYGKDRTKDTRPTQGVFPDEVVHPLSVTDLILSRAFGEPANVDVKSASIWRDEFANREVQEREHAINPSIPLQPTSDVIAHLDYTFGEGDDRTKVPVSVISSFLMPSAYRRVDIFATGSDGRETKLTVDFDVQIEDEDGKRSADTLRDADGTVIYEWGGNKAAAQIAQFLGGTAVGEQTPDTPTSLEKEIQLQAILRQIGTVAAYRS